jgi:hypothetical protein
MKLGVRHAMLSGCAVAALALGSCDDGVLGPGEGLVAPVTWMSWIGGIHSADRATVRLVGVRSSCGDFRIGVRLEGTRVRILPDEAADPRKPCLARDFLQFYDTTVTLPRLAAGNWTIEALTYDPSGVASRAFGTLVVIDQGAFDALLAAGGHAYLLADSAGCSWMRPQIQLPPDLELKVLAVNISLPAGWHPAFVRGGFMQGTARCGQTLRYQMSSAEVEPPAALQSHHPSTYQARSRAAR